MLFVGDNHDFKIIGQEFNYARFGEWAHIHETVHNLHLRHDMLNHTFAVRSIQSGFRSGYPRFMRLAVLSEDFILPVLVDSNFQVAATFVTGKTKRLCIIRLIDGKDDEFGSLFFVDHFTGHVETHNVELSGREGKP